jgi:hypothetical protein
MRYKKDIIDALVFRNSQLINESSYALDDFEGTSVLLFNLFISNRRNIIALVETQEYLFLDFKEYRSIFTIVISLVPKYN